MGTSSLSLSLSSLHSDKTWSREHCRHQNFVELYNMITLSQEKYDNLESHHLWEHPLEWAQHVCSLGQV